jgi:tetratricopeptide (TPR) repeat protein
MRTLKRLAAGLGALMTAGYLHAGAQCRVSGVVSDSTGAMVGDASITITTPNLTTFKTVVKADAKGKWGTLLPDCTMPYHFKFEKDGYLSFDVDKKIPIGDIATIDAKLTSKTEAQAKAAAAAAPTMSSNDKAVAAFNSGVEAMQAGDKAVAETKFLDAVTQNPDLPAGWQALAQLAYEKKDWAKAIEYGQKATDLDPSLTNLYQMMGDAARKSGDKAKAAEFDKAWAEANPDSPDILYNKGVEAYNKGKMKDAEAMLTKAVEAKPDYANAHFWLGMACFNQNKKGPAKEHLEKYLELDPSGKEASTAKEILPLLK